MDEANGFARDLIDAITAAIGRDPKVLACQRRARAAGFELKLAFETKAVPASGGAEDAAAGPASCRPGVTSQVYRVTAADRRFLRSLRIAADETEDAERL